MGIRQSDRHLPRIIGRARREELRPLAHYLATGLLRSTPNEDDVRQANAWFDATDDSDLRRDLIQAIQESGGSLLGNLARGWTGVAYGELLHDVMTQTDAWNKRHWQRASERDDVREALRRDFDGIDRETLLLAERKLFLALLDQSLAKADPEERQRILDALTSAMPDDDDERPRTLQDHGIDSESLARVMGRRMSSMLAYQIALLIAGQVARNVAGQGLRLVIGGALGRYLAVWAGPVGVGLATVLTVHDLTGPAMRKVMPSVLHLAMLDMEQQITPVIGVLGSMSAGKDTMIEALFGIDTGGIDVLPGSTTSATVFDYQDEHGKIRIVNAPGEGDPRDSVQGEAREATDLLDTALLLINAGGSVAGQTERELFDRLVARGVHVIPVLNKVDLCHSRDDLRQLQQSAADALGVPLEAVLPAAAAPDPRLQKEPIGLKRIHKTLADCLGETKRGSLPAGEKLAISVD